MTIKHRKKKTWVITLRRILKQITWIKYLRVWSGLKSRTKEISGHSSGIIIYAAAAAKSFQSCLTLCNPIDSNPPGSPVPGILQGRTLELVAISFSNAWKWKVKGKSLSHVRHLATPWTAAHQAPLSMGFSSQEYWSGAPLPYTSLVYAQRDLGRYGNHK